MEPVIIRQTKFSAYFAAITVTILAVSFSRKTSFEDEFTWFHIVVVALCSLSVYLWIVAILNLPVITISESGLLHKKKMIEWSSVTSYSTTEKKRRKSRIVEWRILLNDDSEYRIDITNLSTDPEQLSKLVSTFSTNSTLEYKGHFNL